MKQSLHSQHPIQRPSPDRLDLEHVWTGFKGLAVVAIALYGVFLCSPANAQMTERDISEIVTTYDENKPRFERDFLGQPFRSEGSFLELDRDVFGKDFVEFIVNREKFYCIEVTNAIVNTLIDTPKRTVFEVRGIIRGVWFGRIELRGCSITRVES